MSAINIQTFVDQQEWKLHEHVEVTKRILKQEYSSSMKNHACLSVTCRAARRPGYFYWNVFLIMPHRSCPNTGMYMGPRNLHPSSAFTAIVHEETEYDGYLDELDEPARSRRFT
ncbi:unnamed protein product [Dicrocoelium dendriticum]|nr:unnamed protein product [Dicrocoelium dendriticum]